MNAPAPQRSLFITALAWTTIVPAACAVLFAGMQNMFFKAFVSPEEFERITSTFAPQLGGLASITYGSLRWMLLLFLATSIVFLLAGIGLLRRRNWARVVFVALVAFSTLYGIGTAVFMDYSSDLVALGMPQATFDGATVDFSQIAAVARGTTIALTAVITIFNLWLIWKLLSPAIRQEFVRNS